MLDVPFRKKEHFTNVKRQKDYSDTVFFNLLFLLTFSHLGHHRLNNLE